MCPCRTCLALCLCMATILLLGPCQWVGTAAATTTASQAVTVTDTASSDREALLCIKSYLSHRNGSGGALATWGSNNGSLDVCRWQGVRCKRRQDSGGGGALRVVTGLSLEGEGVAGQIPPCISNLTYLTRIHLPFNSLGGALPPEIGRLRRLRYVNLSSNALTGAIPTELASCSALRVVSLKKNNLSGGIPAALFKNCYSIQKVDLRMNNLDGPIPDLLPYHSSTDTSSSLQLLGLTQNNLSGEIPSSVGNLSSLVYFLAAQNLLTGSIPGSLASLASIQVIDLTYNNLSGTVPSSIFNLSSLIYLGLGDNGFVGELPATMGNRLPNIQGLILSANNFYGEIPKSIANATNLVDIYMQENSLGGVIPSLGTLRSLQTLFLYNNKKLEAGDDWAFLSSLANCPQLGFLVLDSNRLQGPLPSSVANLSQNLKEFVLGSNLITGAIPSGIGDLANLSVLYLDNNMLSGHIPASIGKLRSMFALNLSKNRLSGEIPASIGDNWAQLTELYLQENSLSGAIPAGLAGCRNLLALNLSSNAFSGPIPEGLFGRLDQLNWYLDLSKNQLAGSIPDEFSNMINLESLNISSNSISGKIPSTLGSCVLLQALRLEANSLDGQIPSSLATLKGIKELDFSRNNLSGKIPEFLEQFDSLQYLNLSFNNLDGPIPTQGVVFGNATSRLFLQGNPKLCAETIAVLGLPLCRAQNPSARNRFLVRFLAVLLPCVVVVSLLSVLFLKRWSRKPRPFHESSEESFKMVTYSDLSMAINGFSPGSLIGSGQSSSVYRGSLPSKTDDVHTMIAVKVFKLGQSSSSKSFLAECRALRNTRHRNLVKVITACSTCDPFGNEFKALVLEYVPNGTLADHLHAKYPGYGDGARLSLGDRIGIAADVASVLEYLHVWSAPPMAHCDIKPSNILLDDDNVAHVGDFGLARFLQHASSACAGGHRNATSSVGAAGSVGYIPPEYGMGSRISTEGDVYSYGIVLLEMLTGKSPTDESFHDGFTLHKYVEEALPRIGEVLDADLSEEVADLTSRTRSSQERRASNTEVHKCIFQLLNLGLLCSQEAPKDRPSIQYVYAEIVQVKEHFGSCSVKET